MCYRLSMVKSIKNVSSVDYVYLEFYIIVFYNDCYFIDPNMRKYLNGYKITRFLVWSRSHGTTSENDCQYR